MQMEVLIWNDIMLELFTIDVLGRYPGAIVMYNILCSRAVKETILMAGGKPFIWRVGHSFLKNKNKEVGRSIYRRTIGTLLFF